MAPTGLFLTCNLLLPVALHHAFHLPTQESPAWDSPLSSVPSWPLLEGLSEEPFPSIPPAVAHSDPGAHEASSGDGNWDGASPAIHPGASLPVMTSGFPGATSSNLRMSLAASRRSLPPQLASQGLPAESDFTLPTGDPSAVQAKPQDFGSVTLELGPEQKNDGPSFPTPGLESASPEMASLPASSGLEASSLPASQVETTNSHYPDLFKDGSSTFTQSPRPSVSTIPLTTVLMGEMATEGSDLRNNTSVKPQQNGIPEQELQGRNVTTVKYMASYQSTQVYDGPLTRKEHSTSPFRPTEAGGYTQTPSGSRRDSGPVASTSQPPQTTLKATPSDRKVYQLAPGSKDSHSPASEELSTRAPVPSPTGTTLGPVSHQRNTHWGLIPDTTQQAGPWDATVTKRTPPSGSSGTGEVADVDVQRVRGAVIPRVPVVSVASSTPGQGSSVVKNNSRSKHADTPGTRPPGWSSHVAPTTSARLPASPRRGLIRVTTQRALQPPQLAKPEPSLPAMLPATSPPCPRPGSACSQLLSNQTLLRWGNLERTLSFAWALHVYGSGLLFLLLSLLSLACLGGSFALRVPHLLNTMGASTLLLVFGMLRATFFLVDPYGSRGWLPARAVRVLYTAPFPLLLSTLVVLLLRLLRQARLQVLPPKWQSLPLWAGLASMQSVVLLGADLISPPMHPSVPVGLHTLSCLAGLCLLPATIYVYLQIRSGGGTAGALEPGVWSGAWVLLASSGLALPCCGLQLYGVLWLSGLLGPADVFTWGWWFVQFWFRMGEIVLSFTLAFLAWQALCQRYGSAEHSCWAKLVRYFCTYRKADTPEYPNNCYDWTGSILEKAPNNDISKNLIRNAPGSGHIWALKDSNELRAAVGHGSSPSPSRPIFSPKCPNAAAAAMGRSYTSICFERDSVISLAELEFRPPSPINLSRSIDEALFREHLVRDSIFLRSSLHFPSRLARQDSCSSLRGDCSTRSHTAQPLLTRPRRSSDPDCLYSLARASSLGELTTQSRGLASEPPTDTSFDSFSHTSFSRASLKISWNPWRHGLSSPESLPPEELPGQGQQLADELPPASSSSAPNSEREARKSFLALSKQVDSRSLSSDTIEL